MKSNFHSKYLENLTYSSIITKTKRGWNVAKVNDKGGGCYEGAHNINHALYCCLHTNILEECLPTSIEIKGVKYTPQEAVQKFMKLGFWYDRIYPQYQVI